MDPVNTRNRSISPEPDPTPAGDAGESRSAAECRDPSPSVMESRADEEPLACPNPAVRSLVDAYSRSAATAKDVLPPGSSATPHSDNNAFRTMQRDTLAPYANTGTTSNGDAIFAGAAALKSRDGRTGVDVEVFSASGQVGMQNEAQAGLARIGYSGERDAVSFSVSGEALTARANLGIHNDDGSQGANLGAMATGAGVEGTIGYGGWSVTAGASVSVGVSLSSGERNVDGDETRERCFKGSIGPLTLGFCSEL